MWLAPVQTRVIPISSQFNNYAEEVSKQFAMVGIRAMVDSRDEKMGYKVRDAEMNKVPVMLIIGQKEVENGQVTLRRRHCEQQSMMDVADLVHDFKEEISNKGMVEK